jgi:hypothetical protein
MMSFTFTNYQASKPEQVSPWANLRHNITQAQNEQTRSKYLPKQLEADIIGKTVGPLAQIAASPLVAAMEPKQKEEMLKYISAALQGSGGKPQQEQEGSFGNVPILGGLEKWITEHLGGAKTHEMPEERSKTVPGFPTNEDLFSRLKEGANSVLGSGGKLNAFKSTIGTGLNQIVGNNPISEALSDKGEAAGAKAAFEQTKKDLEQKLIREGRSPQMAHFIAQEQPGENAEQYVKNREQYLIPQNRKEPENNYSKNSGLSKEIIEEATALNVSPELVEEDAKGFHTSPKIILGAIRAGIATDDEMRDYIAGVKNGR